MKPPRPKLPPYGRAVLEARDAVAARGEALACVRVFYGADPWQAAKDAAPALCVPAQDYEPGKYDWEPVAGLPVELHWLDGEQPHELAAELAAVAAPVTVKAGARQWDAADFVFKPDGRGGWEPIWSSEQREEYKQRVDLYLRCIAADVCGLELSDDDRRRIAGG